MPNRDAARRSTQLRLAVTPTFSRQMLMPHLELFRNIYPDVELVMQVSIPLLDVTAELHDLRRAGKDIMFEGAQGSLLDIDHGTYPYVTSSNTTAGGVATGSGVGPMILDYILGITKAYTTRVGSGPFPTELFDAVGAHLAKQGHEFGATTGRPRRCGWFDAVVVRYAVRVNGLSDLAVTKLDVLDTLDELQLCTGYRVGGEIYTEFPGDLEALERAEPLYETFPGWRTSTANARSLADLPAEARAYLERIESLVEAPITHVSVGTRRDQIIGL